MSSRIRWLNVKCNVQKPLERITEGMYDDEYTLGASSGFITKRVTSSFVQGQYVERFQRKIQLIDPLGTEYSTDTIEYIITDFKFFVDSPEIEILNAPRSIAPAINQIANILGLGSVITPVSVSPSSWLEYAEGLNNICVKNAQFSRISLAENVSAKVQITGTVDVRSFFELLAGSKSSFIDKLDVIGDLHGERIRFSLREDGKAILNNHDDNVCLMLRDALSNLISSK